MMKYDPKRIPGDREWAAASQEERDEWVRDMRLDVERYQWMEDNNNGAAATILICCLG